ncbi:MAG: hypothetical protein GXP48_10790 [Acidobacteria bacterium]|nr:hypothetical protein [Acidobacteriota bacterium]
MTGETSQPDVHGAEPFPIEGEPLPPTPTPAEDVFEETSPRKEAERPLGGALKTTPADESTLLDITLPEIGRPYGYDEQHRPPRHWRGWIVAATAVVVIGVLGALGAWYAGWFDTPHETVSASPTPSGTEQRPVRSPADTSVSVAPRRQGGGPAAGAVLEPSPTASPRPTATATPAPSPTPTTAPAPVALPARTIRSIRWSAATSGTTVRIVPSGVLTTRRVRVILLDDPPRALVRIRGIRAPYPQPVIQAGSPELARIRIWLHSELRPPELYVVLDLARPGVRVRTRLRYGTVIVTLRRPRAR